MKKNKGITLIALVITIIVMLILVAVTITIAVNGGLFDYAGRAAQDTETKKQEELEYTNIPINWTYENLIDKYAAKEIITFSIVDTQYQAEKGMTWEEWINNNDYNSAGMKITTDDLVASRDDVRLVRNNGFYVRRDDEILENFNYLYTGGR